MNQEKNNNQSIIRGAAAFFILLTHISAFTKENCIFRAFSQYGYFWVAIFFFYSGLNLINSFIKKETFFKKFWYKKITKIYIPLVISNILFLIIKHFLNNIDFSKKETIFYIFGIKCINEVNWYIYSICLFYLSAWIILLLFSRIKNIKDSKILLTIISILIAASHVFLYYNTAMHIHITTSLGYVVPVTLLFGMLVGIFNKEIKRILKNDLIFEFLVIFLFFAFSLFHYANMQKIEFLFFNLKVIDLLSAAFFAVFVILVSTRVNLKSRLCLFMDKISLETYIFHFVILNLFYNDTFKIKNSYLFLLIYFLFTIFISIIIKKIVDVVFYRKKTSC